MGDTLADVALVAAMFHRHKGDTLLALHVGTARYDVQHINRGITFFARTVKQLVSAVQQIHNSFMTAGRITTMLETKTSLL